MNTSIELDRIHQITALLGEHLPAPSPGLMPEEVTETLHQARSCMRDIPMAIEDLKAAKKEFAILDWSIGRMIALAGEAIALPDEDQDGRDRLEVEFVQLSKVIAQAAGRDAYEGPAISIRTRPEAKAAGQIMEKLIGVKEDLSIRLAEQERVLMEAVDGTLVFLMTVAESYPRDDTTTQLSHILRRVECIGGTSGAGLSQPAASGGLH